MTRQTEAAERWVTEDLEDVHSTVEHAPALVRNNQEMVRAAQGVIQRYQAEVRDPNASLTVRQIFYQLIEVIGLKNTKASYEKVSDVLTAARLEGLIPWGHITDRSRAMLAVSMWENLADFARSAAVSYRGDVWATQEQQVLCWVEKDARAAWVRQIVAPYGVTVVPGRGATSWGLIREVAQALGDGYSWSVLYLGDFDPSGLIIGEHNRKGLAALGCRPEWRVLAVRHEDMPDIPPAAWQEPKGEHWDERQGRIVKGDPNTPKFLNKYGVEQKCAEVDSMPPILLRARILDAVQQRMDLPAWRRRMRLDSAEKEAVRQTLAPLARDQEKRRAMEADARAYQLAYANREDLEEAERTRLADYE